MSYPQHSFLLATFEGGGSVAPALTVARKLVDRGHHVRVMSDASNQMETEAAGAVFVAWTRAPSRPNRNRDTDILHDWEVSPQEGLLRTLERLMVGPALAYAQDLIAELTREPADLVVGSEMLFGVALGCEAVGQRLAILSANISLYPLPGVPPLGPGLLPAQTPEEHAMHRAVAQGLNEMLNTQLPALNSARTQLGLEPLSNVLDQLDAASAILLGTSRSFDFAPAALPPKVRYVGPQLDQPAWADGCKTVDHADQRPLILVAFSTTFQGHVEVLQRVVDAVSGMPVRAIVTLGDTISPDELRAPQNVTLVHSGSHDELMNRAALLITHGGHGTVIRGLINELPMLVIPHGRDQNDNAARVTSRGAGLMLPNSASEDEIEAAVLQLLADPRFRQSARRLGRAVAHDAAHSPVVSELEGLAQYSDEYACADVQLPMAC